MAIAFLGLSTSLIGAFGGSAMSVWFAETARHHEENLDRGVGRRNSYTMVAKLLGMSLGPVLYSQLGLFGLLADAGCALSVFFCLTKVASPAFGAGSGEELPLRKMFAAIDFTPEVRALLALAFLGGATSFPLINAGLYTLREVFSASEFYISAFWLTGAVGSLIANSIMAYGWTERFASGRVFTAAMIISLLGISLMSVSAGPVSLVLSFGLVTLANPVMNNLSFTRLILRARDVERGRLVALASTLTDLSVLILLSTFVKANQHMIMPLGLLWLLPLILARAVFAGKALRS